MKEIKISQNPSLVLELKSGGGWGQRKRNDKSQEGNCECFCGLGHRVHVGREQVAIRREGFY